MEHPLMTSRLNKLYSIEQLVEITTDPHCNSVWRQLLDTMREIQARDITIETLQGVRDGLMRENEHLKKILELSEINLNTPTVD